jgi:hypothetical protein
MQSNKYSQLLKTDSGSMIEMFVMGLSAHGPHKKPEYTYVLPKGEQSLLLIIHAMVIDVTAKIVPRRQSDDGTHGVTIRSCFVS